MCRVSDVSPPLRHRAALWFVTNLEQGDQHPRKRRECSRYKNERSKTALEGVLVQKRPNIICQGGGQVGDRHQDRKGKAFRPLWTIVRGQSECSHEGYHRGNTVAKVKSGCGSFIKKQKERRGGNRAQDNTQLQ
jgi:hypothetical protein